MACKIYVRNEQTNTTESSIYRDGWIQVPGGAHVITAGPRAVWVGNADGYIYKQSEKFLF